MLQVCSMRMYVRRCQAPSHHRLLSNHLIIYRSLSQTVLSSTTHQQLYQRHEMKTLEKSTAKTNEIDSTNPLNRISFLGHNFESASTNEGVFLPEKARDDKAERRKLAQLRKEWSKVLKSSKSIHHTLEWFRKHGKLYTHHHYKASINRIAHQCASLVETGNVTLKPAETRLLQRLLQQVAVCVVKGEASWSELTSDLTSIVASNLMPPRVVLEMIDTILITVEEATAKNRAASLGLATAVSPRVLVEAMSLYAKLASKDQHSLTVSNQHRNLLIFRKLETYFLELFNSDSGGARLWCDSKDISRVLWSLAKCNRGAHLDSVSNQLVKSFVQAAKSIGSTFKPQDISNSLWAVTSLTVQARPDTAVATEMKMMSLELFESFHDRTISLFHNSFFWKTQELTSLMWSYATMIDTVGQAEGHSLLSLYDSCHAIQKYIAKESMLLSHYQPHELATLIWSAAKIESVVWSGMRRAKGSVNTTPSARPSCSSMLEQLSAFVLKQTAAFTSRELSWILWAYAVWPGYDKGSVSSSGSVLTAGVASATVSDIKSSVFRAVLPVLLSKLSTSTSEEDFNARTLGTMLSALHRFEDFNYMDAHVNKIFTAIMNCVMGEMERAACANTSLSSHATAMLYSHFTTFSECCTKSQQQTQFERNYYSHVTEGKGDCHNKDPASSVSQIYDDSILSGNAKAMVLSVEDVNCALECLIGLRSNHLEPKDIVKILLSSCYSIFDSDNSTLFRMFEHRIISESSLFTSSELISVIWCFAYKEIDAPLVFKTAERSLISRGLRLVEASTDHQNESRTVGKSTRTIEKITPIELSKLCWSLASSGYATPMLFRQIMPRILGNLDSFNIRSLSNIIWSFATVCGPTSQYNSEHSDPGEAALLSYFKPSRDHEDLTIFRKAASLIEIQFGVTECSKNTSMEEIRYGLAGIRGGDIAQMTWAYGHLGLRVPGMFRALEESVFKELDNLTARELSMILWSYAVTGNASHTFCRTISQRICRQLLLLQDTKSDLSALVELRGESQQHKCFEEKESSEAASVATPMRFTVQGVTTIAWAMSLAGYYDPVLFMLLKRQIGHQRTFFKSADLNMWRRVSEWYRSSDR